MTLIPLHRLSTTDLDRLGVNVRSAVQQEHRQRAFEGDTPLGGLFQTEFRTSASASLPQALRPIQTR